MVIPVGEDLALRFVQRRRMSCFNNDSWMDRFEDRESFLANELGIEGSEKER